MAWRTWALATLLLASASVSRAAEAERKPTVAPAPVVTEPLTGADLVFVKGGCFKMGDQVGDGESADLGPVEQPVHEVCVDDYYLGKTEVTQGQWKAVMGSELASRIALDEDDHPVGDLSYEQVQEFIGRLNAKAGEARYRLPTEAEWEFAARSRGRADQKYSGGNDVESVSWFDQNSEEGHPDAGRTGCAHAVATKAPNGLGLYDMSGNAWELVSDWFSPKYYTVSPRQNPRGPDSGEVHVKRGGCCSGASFNQRTSMRDPYTSVDNQTTFRLARNP
jgi:formylglycine-generating enzyme required for sulfatase activity